MANPTIEQFESNPRSAVIRRTCLEIVGEIEQLTNDSDENAPHLANIEALRNHLIEIGVTPNMYAGDNRLAPEAYADPGIMAEYVAGQVLLSTDDGGYPHWVVSVAYRFLNGESSDEDDDDEE
jgi:hypothetical protein